MYVWLQWAENTARQLGRIPHTSWAGLEKRPVPQRGELGGQDNVKGWVNCMNIQGVVFSADHYCVMDLGGGVVRCVAWNDDPDDYPSRAYFGREFFCRGGPERRAVVMDFQNPVVDASKGKGYNTNFTTTAYYDCGGLDLINSIPGARQTCGGAQVIDNFKNFVEPPDDASTKHGVWLTDAKYNEHLAMLTHHGWPEWIV